MTRTRTFPVGRGLAVLIVAAALVGATMGVAFGGPLTRGWLRAALGGGSGVTLLAGTYLAAMARRTARAEALVRQRTQEMRDFRSKVQELHAALLSSLSKQRKLTEELIAAKNAADAANQARSDLLSAMGLVEMRTPAALEDYDATTRPLYLGTGTRQTIAACRSPFPSAGEV